MTLEKATQGNAAIGPTASESAGRARVSVEAGLYALLAIGALILRLADLDARLMSPLEASRALGALQLANGVEPAIAHSPILVHGAALFFMFLRAGDFFARMTPALFGAALVLTPVLFRRQLGRVGALVAAVVFALSPVGLYYSRYLGPEIIVVTAALTGVGAVVRFRETSDRRWLILAGGALGALLVSGPGAWTVILLAVLLAGATALLCAFGRQSALWEVGADLVARVGRNPGAFGAVGIAFGAVIVAVGSGALLHLWGLAGIGQQLSDWLAGFRVGSGDMRWYGPAALVLLYEPVVVVFGVAGIIRAVRAAMLWRGLLAYWALGALAFLLLWPGRTGGDLLLVLAPLTLLAAERVGALLDSVWERAERHRDGLVLAIALVLCGYLYMQLAAYANSGQRGYLTLVLVAFGLLLLLGAGAAGLASPGVAVRGVALAGLIVLALCTVSAARSVAYDTRENRVELLGGPPTDAGVARLVDTLTRISLQRVDGEYDLPVTLVGEKPFVLEWYLRRVAQLTVTPGLSSTFATPAVIAPASMEQSPGTDYTGQRFTVRTFDDLWGLEGRQLLRWMFFRERPQQPPPGDGVILWIKLDTAPQ